MASEPTRGPATVSRSTPCRVDTPDGAISVNWTSNDYSSEPKAEATARLVASSINASTAARDLGFDAIGAIEALPLLIEACRKANSCASLPDAVKQLCREAVSAARKRGDA